MLVGLMVLVVTPFSQSLQRDPNTMLAFHGGSGSSLLTSCQAALRMQMDDNKVTMISPTAAGIQEAVDGSFCKGYVVGVVDELISFSVTNGTTYCIPTNADNEQLIRIVAKYLDDNPSKLNDPAGMLVTKAIVGAFPCN